MVRYLGKNIKLWYTKQYFFRTCKSVIKFVSDNQDKSFALRLFLLLCKQCFTTDNVFGKSAKQMCDGFG